MEVATIISFDATSTSSNRGVGCHRYWPVGAWSKFESCSINFEGLATLRFEGH
jgi:hypothetical protein